MDLRWSTPSLLTASWENQVWYPWIYFRSYKLPQNSNSPPFLSQHAGRFVISFSGRNGQLDDIYVDTFARYGNNSVKPALQWRLSCTFLIARWRVVLEDFLHDIPCTEKFNSSKHSEQPGWPGYLDIWKTILISFVSRYPTSLCGLGRRCVLRCEDDVYYDSCHSQVITGNRGFHAGFLAHGVFALSHHHSRHGPLTYIPR